MEELEARAEEIPAHRLGLWSPGQSGTTDPTTAQQERRQATDFHGMNS